MKKTISVILSFMMLVSVFSCTGFSNGFLPKAKAAVISEYSFGDTFEFGWYPQSEVTDETLKAKLDSLGGDWYSLGYYSGGGNGGMGNMVKGDWMQYKDVLYNGVKYRALQFSQYRPYIVTLLSSEENSRQDENGYYTDTVYWFRYEPIVWTVLDPDVGMVMSLSILDAQPFSNTIYHEGDYYYRDEWHTVYVNNYQDSHLRAWLNTAFFDDSFSAAQKDMIEYTEIDNSASSEENAIFSSPNTTDKVYLLSLPDAKNPAYGFQEDGFTFDPNRLAQGTAYAKCNGLWAELETAYSGNHDWWLRTAGHTYYNYSILSRGDQRNIAVGATCEGVRPVINLSPETEILQSDVADVGDFSVSVHDTHIWNAGVETASPTCTEPGTMLYTCTVSGCGETMEEDILPLGHDYIDHKAQAPTCIAVGWNAYQTCSRCIYTSYEELQIDENNHVNTTETPETDSSCVVPGVTAGVYCNDCKKYISGHAEKQLGDHVWNDGVVTKEATCAETGITLYTCTVPNCNKTKEEQISIDSQNHNYTAVVTPPNCTERGYTTYTCTRCPDSYVDDYVNATGHSFGAWQTVTPATCHTKGVAKRTCACGAYEEKTLNEDLSNHNGETEVRNAAAATCTAAGYTGDIWCLGCGNKIISGSAVNAKGHSWGDWQTTKEATEEAAGEQVRECSVCHAVETRAIPAKGSNKCKWCGQIHTGIWGNIVSVFHSIMYIFAQLFGR